MKNAVHSGTLAPMSEPESLRNEPLPQENFAANAAGRAESAVGKDDSAQPRELGGPAGSDPTRYGDWERKGRCIDF